MTLMYEGLFILPVTQNAKVIKIILNMQLLWWIALGIIILITISFPPLFDVLWMRYSKKYSALTNDRKVKINIKTLYALYFGICFLSAIILMPFWFCHFITIQCAIDAAEHNSDNIYMDITAKLLICGIIPSYLCDCIYRYKYLEWHRWIHHIATIIYAFLLFQPLHYSFFDRFLPRYNYFCIAMLDVGSFATNIHGIYYYIGGDEKAVIHRKVVLYAINAAYFSLEFMIQISYYSYLILSSYSLLTTSQMINVCIMELAMGPTQISATIDTINIIRLKLLKQPQPETTSITDA